MALTLEKGSGDVWALMDGATLLAEVNGATDTVRINGTLALADGKAISANAGELNLLDGLASNVTVALAAATGANNMRMTITATDAAGTTVAAVHQLEVWMSEAATGIGLTADTYSGDLVALTGAIHTALTAKKHWSVVTAASGIFTADLEDTAKPADQYVAVKKPLGAGVVVSVASGVLWGA